MKIGVSPSLASRLLLCMAASSVLAQSPDGELPAGSDLKRDFDNACTKERDIPNVRFFETSAAVAESIVDGFCSRRFDEERVVSGVQRVLESLTREASDHGLDTDPTLEMLAINAGLIVESEGVAPSMTVREGDDSYQLVISPHRARAALEQCSRVAVRVSEDEDQSCDSYFREIKTIYDHAQAVYSNATAAPLARALTALDGQWDRFLEQSKAQTPWEVAYNGWRFQREHKDARGFVPPPDRQYIVLHPSIAIDYTNGATDGEQMQEAIVIDIAGVNWWGPKARWLSGFALHTAYSDRAEVDDWGYGISLFFRSNYTVGVTWRDDDVGLFVSVDLLKPLNDASAIMKAFRD